MATGFFKVPKAVNEPVKSYAKGSKERAEVLALYKELYNKEIDVPLYIGSDEIRTGKKVAMHPPHDHQHVLGYYHLGDVQHVELAVEKALEARKTWSEMRWEQRAAIFLRAADLLAGPYRAKINAATMLAQSKNVFQAEIDAACELIDFFNFNVEFMTEIYSNQPESSKGIWNRMEYRPLEGFVYAITPFNFTSIAGNLPAAPALMGNVVVWKPSRTQIYSANILMELFKEAGLPDGVINMVTGNSSMITDTLLSNKHFAGIHFTGSTRVFKSFWTTIGNNIDNYISYPRIVGETGGKDFVWMHNTADAKQVATGLSRGAFEYQGQKCSAASRAYIPASKWEEVRGYLEADLKSMKMGSPDDTSNFINAVIDEISFDKLAGFIDQAKKDADAEVIIGGNSSQYALTGAIFALDRKVIEIASDKLQNAAGNFYINDKPTGAVVGQQPFGGARGSGTNDKAGSVWNLLRWVSNRTIKETFVPPSDYRYPFLEQ